MLKDRERTSSGGAFSETLLPVLPPAAEWRQVFKFQTAAENHFERVLGQTTFLLRRPALLLSHPGPSFDSARRERCVRRVVVGTKQAQTLQNIFYRWVGPPPEFS